MTARHELIPEHEQLVGAFTEEMTRQGRKSVSSVISGARAFCFHFGGPNDFAALPLPRQLELRHHHLAFASWLMVTGRMAVPATYLAQANLCLGTAARKCHPDLWHRVEKTATMLGSDPTWVRSQWSALVQVAALFGRLPGGLGAADIDRGAEELTVAFSRRGQKKSGHRLRSSFVRLRSTLYHAGLIDVAPRLLRRNQSEVRA